ncbi:hypothetical protein [Aeoliella mucimassa]|uniref:Uncharacterized protein n=1 Tax=Aeoliella mucimassa TaxID=2527972 RepID=A0A518AGL9_9BACT|nr:hypothetical protein [Aeoliella mucimassa]QDU53883.1 hypothetical protein Pan181_00610 [Aeoliella mucimassa]
MAKRVLMMLLFVGALGAASLMMPNTAEARGHRYGPPVRHYHNHGRVQHRGYYAPRAAYYAPRYYAPRYYAPRVYAPRYNYGGGGVYLNGARGGLYIGW